MTYFGLLSKFKNYSILIHAIYLDFKFCFLTPLMRLLSFWMLSMYLILETENMRYTVLEAVTLVHLEFHYVRNVALE